jgi:tetratricopeptide (TPR) repeat protein/ankyrin repeat protein
MPRSVQSDLVSQIRIATTDVETIALRRSAVYDLAMCYYSGFGVEAVDVDKALALLLEAAELGSPRALAISFRLHYALRGQVPTSLLELDDPAILAEKELLNVPAEAYFAERVRRFEILNQQEALRQRYDIFYCGKLIADGVYLSNAEQALPPLQGLDLQQLKCVCQPGDQGGPVIQGLLVHTAIRLGLLPLVKFLLSIHQPSPSQSHVSIFSHIEGETALCAACRGGHLEMLVYLLSKGAESTVTKWATTALHWLIMFPAEDMKKALELLIATPQGYLCFACNVVDPGIDMHYTHLLGTPLEFAIAVNNVPLVQLLLAAQPSAKHKNHTNCVTCLGWQDSTFRYAVSSHLSNLLPILLPHELTYRRSRPLFNEKARFLRAKGKPEMPPFGLFDIPHAPNPIFMLLMHGKSSRAALETSIDYISGSGICSLNDEDSDCSTALTHAVRVAPCDINTDIISALISRGARFGVREEPQWILTNCIAKRNDHSAGAICRLLLKSGLFPLSTELLSAAVRTGNERIIQEFLSFDEQGRKLDINTPLVQEGEPIPILHIALLAPNSAKLINLLLDYGANIDAQWDGRTVLQLVVCTPESDGDAIDLLITRGASLCPDGTSILHIAASKRAYVNGIHVIYRLLEHESVRKLLNFDYSPGSDGQEFHPLHVACLAGNLEAVQALLGGGAEVKRTSDEVDLINLCRAVGRRPELSTMWDGNIDDEDAAYSWRRDVEGIILALLGRSDPGHRRTELHVAVELGNFKRVVELVKQGGLSLWDGDRNSMTPLGFLEDANVAKEAGESEAYITNLERIRQYLMEQVIHETSVIMEDPKALETLLEGFAASESESQEAKKARGELETKLQELRVKDNFPLGSGLDEPFTLESKYNQLLAEQKSTLGETHADTLRTMTSLSKVYCMQARYDEAEKLQMQALKAREAQLDHGHPDLYISYSDRIRILCSLSRYEDAEAQAHSATIQALDTFGPRHPVVLSLSCDMALLDECAGNISEAVKSQELTLRVYEGLESREQCRLALLELKRSLVSNYCKMGKFKEASDLVLLGQIAYSLEYVRAEEFLESFHCLIFGIAMTLDEHQRWEDSETVYARVVEIVQQVHGERKSYCTYMALRLSAEHYQKRKMWKQECETLEKLLKYLKSSFGLDHLNTLNNMLNLAQVYEKLNRMLEANLLQEQAVQMLETTLGPDHLQTLMGKSALCTSCRKLDRLEKSESVGQEAFNGYSRVLGDEDERTLNAADQLAVTLSAREKFAEATELQERVVDVLVLVHGEVQEKTRKGVENLCATLLRQRRFDEAEMQGRRCLKIGLELDGENSHAASHGLYILAQCKELAGETEKAIELFLQSIDAERAHRCGNNAVSLFLMRCLSKLYLDTEQYDAAEKILRALLAEAPRIYGGEKEDEVQIATSHLGFVCEETGRQEEAVKHYEAAVQAARHVYGDWHDETMNCISDLVRVYINLDRMRDAHMLAREILRYKSEKLGIHHEETIEAKGDLSSIYYGLCMWPEAERMQRDILRHLQAADPDNLENEDTIPWMDALSWSCSKQGRYDEAEKLARSALEYKTKTLGARYRETVQPMIDLAYVLADSNKQEEAVELNAKALDILRKVSDPLAEQLLAAQSQLAYILFHQDKLDAAETAQLQVLDQKPDDADELEFLFKIYVKMERFDMAEKIGKQALAVRRKALGEGLQDWDVLQMMAKMTELYASMGRWEEARNLGERTLDVARKLQIEGLYRDSEVVVEALQALKLVYESIGEEEELLKISLAVSFLFRDFCSIWMSVC